MMAEVDIEDQVSVTNNDNGEIFDSSSEEGDSGSVRVGLFSARGLIQIGEGDAEHDVIKTCFLSGVGSVAKDTMIVSVLKSSTADITTKAKFLAFRVFTEAVAKKNSGDANLRYAWYGGSKEEIRQIMSHGFSGSLTNKPAADAGSYGVGIHLVPSKFSIAGALSTEPDEDGLRHLLLCRIILGKSEVVSPGSKQSHPSSTKFDSGVDNLQNPRKYIIWSCSMNSHILPSYIVSFRAPYFRGPSRGEGTSSKPNSPWISFPSLISLISKSLDPYKMSLIFKRYGDFREGKIRRDQLVRRMREVAGDDLLAEIIKHGRDKSKDR